MSTYCSTSSRYYQYSVDSNSRSHKKLGRIHRPGIEPGSLPWQGSILPLDQRCGSCDALSVRCEHRAPYGFCQGETRQSPKLSLSRLPVRWERGKEKVGRTKRCWEVKSLEPTFLPRFGRPEKLFSGDSGDRTKPGTSRTPWGKKDVGK